MPTIYKAFRFALEPKPVQEVALSAWASALRFLWNWMLAQRTEAYRASEGRVCISYGEQSGQLPAMKQMFPWLGVVPSQSLQQTLKDLDMAFKRFFEKKAGYPAFKSKSRGNPGIRWPQGVEVNGRAVRLPKLGWVKARFSREVSGAIKSATVRFDGLRWQVSILCEVEHDAPAHQGSNVGLDAGVEESVALSDGRLIKLPVANEAKTRQARKLARRVTRCVPGSERHAKAKRRLLVFRRRIGNRVGDARQKLTTALAKNHSLIVVEDLALRHMTRSARGTVEAPGRNVAAKSGLNRMLLEQGHAETVRQLTYKAGWLGGEVRLVNPAYTSQTCPQCGHVSAGNRPFRAVFRCVKCGHCGHADVVAAQNILSAGLAASARGGPLGSAEAGTAPNAPACLAGVAAKGIPAPQDREDVKSTFRAIAACLRSF
jgi:putative transposase